MKEFGEYPIDTHLAGIGAALRKGDKCTTCLIKAEPGDGKTTRVPLYLLNIINGGVLVLEPRRLAARLAAERCAWFLDEPRGHHVGFRIRQQSSVSRHTRLTFITEGLFLRLLRNNPTLEGVGAVIIDEFHERNIYTDIALALVRTLRQTQRPDLKLLVMSATLDTTSLEKYLEDAIIFDVGGRIFPVEIEYYQGKNPGIPMEMNLKNEKRLKIRYREGKEPWAKALIFDCFGLVEHPFVPAGKQRIILHLLGPNRGPVQVTGDLIGFWAGSYRQVHKELSRRYPKHHWPENPAQAKPVALKRLLKK